MPSSTLVIRCSPAGERSVSRLLLDELLAQRRHTHPDDHVVVRDLAAMGAALPHVDGVFSQAIFVPPPQRSAEQQQSVRLSDELIDELLAAQTLIVATPMYNLSVPSSLKAWIDHVVRPGRTFSYNAGVLQGLLTGKKVILLCASGGVFSNGLRTGEDFCAPARTFWSPICGRSSASWASAMWTSTALKAWPRTQTARCRRRGPSWLPRTRVAELSPPSWPWSAAESTACPAA